MIFALSKVFWTIANPANLLVLGLVVGTVLLLLPRRWAKQFGTGLVGVTAVAALAIAVLPLGSWLLDPLEERFPPLIEMPARVDGIIVLSGADNLPKTTRRRSPGGKAYSNRIAMFVALARRYPDAKLVFSGGSGLLFNQDEREADAVAPVLQSMGLNIDHVVFERESRNTRENAVYSKAMVSPQQGEVWLLVTSAFHMPRAVGVFRRENWPVIPVPVDDAGLVSGLGGLDFDFQQTLGLLTLASHEWIGLAAYWSFGWTDTFFPGPADGHGNALKGAAPSG